MSDLASKYYEIVRKQYNNHRLTGFTDSHAYCTRVLDMILEEMQKTQNKYLEQKHLDVVEKKDVN
jgi:hypothetical protein